MAIPDGSPSGPCHPTPAQPAWHRRIGGAVGIPLSGGRETMTASWLDREIPAHLARYRQIHVATANCRCLMGTPQSLGAWPNQVRRAVACEGSPTLRVG